MCGCYRLSRRKQFIEEYFSTVSDEDDWTPRYNIAPTQPVAVIRQDPKEPRREFVAVKPKPGRPQIRYSELLVSLDGDGWGALA
jgi:putative SOS response-associated peptidase YedK